MSAKKEIILQLSCELLSPLGRLLMIGAPLIAERDTDKLSRRPPRTPQEHRHAGPMLGQAEPRRKILFEASANKRGPLVSSALCAGHSATLPVDLSQPVLENWGTQDARPDRGRIAREQRAFPTRSSAKASTSRHPIRAPGSKTRSAVLQIARYTEAT